MTATVRRFLAVPLLAIGVISGLAYATGHATLMAQVLGLALGLVALVIWPGTTADHDDCAAHDDCCGGL